ncbi:phage replisome organizer N-terminal domain-containing protein [Oceanobacillus sp. CF4.6]|uniref:phage replisome organizer N-terminal domain-containing protein n=1 Tax=Oceanobacillus sp. CF4.6 TaxID=3373080 RepID=UPI003EE4D07E
MGNLKWIKLDISMFDDEKVKLIEQMPESDTILIIWIKLLTQAGKTNANGYIYLSENIPFTEEMLATIFGRPLNTVRLALRTLSDFGMIQFDEDSFIQITNWEKHQNVEGMERIRQQNKLRKQKQRDREKAKKLEQKPKNVTSRDCHATEEERREKKEDKEEELQHTSEIIQFWDKNGFGVNNIHAKKQLLLWLDDSSFKEPSKVILKALNIACENDARRLKYTEGILKNWENESLLTVEEIDNSQNKRQKQVESVSNIIDYNPVRDRF